MSPVPDRLQARHRPRWLSQRESSYGCPEPPPGPAPRRARPPRRLDDPRPPIPALRHVVRVPQALHEDGPRTADALEPPTDLRRPRREAEARERRNHDVECILGAAALL